MTEPTKQTLTEKLRERLTSITLREIVVIVALVLITSPLWQPVGFLGALIVGGISAYVAPRFLQRVDAWFHPENKQ